MEGLACTRSPGAVTRPGSEGRKCPTTYLYTVFVACPTDMNIHPVLRESLPVSHPGPASHPKPSTEHTQRGVGSPLASTVSRDPILLEKGKNVSHPSPYHGIRAGCKEADALGPQGPSTPPPNLQCGGTWASLTDTLLLPSPASGTG